MTNILLFSDLHGLARARMLLEFSEKHNYDLAFGLGDYGSLFNTEFLLVMEELTKLHGFYTIHGNHDDVDTIQKMPNWLPDGESTVEGLKLFCLGGVFGTHKEKPYHHTFNQVLNLVERSSGPVDLVLSHEHPALLEYHTHSGTFKFREDREQYKLFAEQVAEKLKPKVWCYGHSRSNVAERTIPELGLRTIGLDGRFVITDEKFNIVESEEVIQTPF